MKPLSVMLATCVGLGCVGCGPASLKAPSGKPAAEPESRLEELRRLAEAGDPTAQNKLDVAYREGDEVKRDYAEAAHWYRKAAEQGNAQAQYNLGVMFMEGWGASRTT